MPKLINLKGELSEQTDEPSTKVRKPYTITKQRERWTEEEHKNFLEALKLHGRAWRKIEEHIGTKTAVQIRSHAQKFFSKLEREASLGKSEGPGAAQDLEVPPPRPKRKPIHPYPRKIKKKPGKVLLQSGPSTSLRLFGQTFVFPVPENGETLTTHMAQANAKNSPFELVTIIDAAESGHEIEVSAQSVCVPASCKNGDDAREKSVSTVQFEDTFGVAATTESSKVKTLNVCVDECDVAESSNEHSMHVSSMVTECSDNDEGCPVAGHHLERTSPLLEGLSSTSSLPPFLNSELPHPVKTVAMNCMRYLQELSNKLLPHFPVETVLLNCMRHFREEANEFHMRTDCDNSERLSLTAFQFFLSKFQQYLPTYGTTRSWANPISGSPLHDERKYDIGAVDSSTFSTFMLAAASACFALQGAFLPKSVPPFKGEKVYNPIAILASEVPSFLSSMYPLKPGIPGRKQDASAACINTGTRKDSDFFQEQGVSNDKKDELASSIKEQVPVNTAKISKECYRSSEHASRESCYKISYCPAEAGPAIKRIKRSLSKKMENIHEASGSFSGSNMVASISDCERKGDEKSLFCPSKSYSDRQDPTICNQQGSTFSLFGDENGDCSAQRICCARSYVAESEGCSDLFARLDIESGDPGMKFGTVDGNKGCLLPDDDECMLVNVGETNTQKLTRQPRSKPFDQKKTKQKKSDLDYSATHSNHSLRAWERFSEDYENELHLARSTKTLSNEEQCPCNNCAEEGKNCLNFPCTEKSTSLRVDVNDSMEGSMQSESAHRCIDVGEGLGKRMPLVKAESLKVSKSYSGAGFVPYWKFLEDAKLKFTGL